MDTFYLEIISGLTLGVSLWVLGMVHKLALDIRSLKADVKHMPTRREVDKMIAEHAVACAQHRAKFGE